jgi:hypothetical protein
MHSFIILKIGNPGLNPERAVKSLIPTCGSSGGGGGGVGRIISIENGIFPLNFS